MRSKSFATSDRYDSIITTNARTNRTTIYSAVTAVYATATARIINRRIKGTATVTGPYTKSIDH
jgi:hypothetical protein